MPKKMRKFYPELFAALADKIHAHGYNADKKKMFGHKVFFLNGYMFAGANESGVFVHIGKDARDKALKEEQGVEPFEPLEGTIMKEYLILNKQIYSDDHKLKKWLDQSSHYLDSLPAKKKND